MRARRQAGFTYLGLIILVFIVGLVGAATLKVGALLQRAQQGLAHRMPSGRGWSSGRVSRSRVSSM